MSGGVRTSGVRPRLMLYYLKLNSGIPASAVLFQLHGGMVSHMQVLATPSSTVHKTKYLDPYTKIILVLAAFSSGSDVGM